ncbi:ABC transporter substrate-binding protein [Terrarubrum flagellatum]|uniref:ABC transporter substrate-binding protein n=1 Tax=Terrirubrum flagellatum TaxID=2895980 RepID=UPI003144F6D2
MTQLSSACFAACAALALMAAPASAQDAPGVTKDSVTIGSWIALSGPIAIYGAPIKAGAQAYLDLVNASGGVKGRKINWIVEDSAYNPQQAVSIARKLVTRDNVLAIAHAHGTAQIAATFPFVVDQAKVPVLVPYGGAKEWYNPPKSGVLGLHVLYEEQAEALGRWAAKDGHRKVLVIHGAASAFENVANNVKPGLQAVAKDADVELMAVKIGTTDYGPIAVEVARKKPDAIVAIQILQEVVQLSKGLKQQGQNIPIYSYAPTVAQSTIELGGEFAEGLKSLSFTASPFADTPAMKEYRDALAKYAPSEKPDFTSLVSYGAMKIFVEALRRADEPLTRDSLVKAFYKLKDYDSGIYPPVTFAPDKPLGGHILQPMQVKDGKWVNVGEPVDTWKF